MSWILLALLSPTIDAVITFIDKYLVERKVKDVRCLPIYGGVSAFIFGTVTWLLAGRPLVGAKNTLLVLAAGAFCMWAYPLYYNALSKNHASYITALFQITPVFTLVLSWFLLGEQLFALQFAGFVLVLIGVLGLSIDKVERRIKLDRSFYQILLANLLFAIAAVLLKTTTDLGGFAPVAVYSSWGLALGAACLFLVRRIRRSFLESLRSTGKSTMGIMLGTETLASLSQGILFLAYTLGPVALVSVLGGTQVFWAILFGALLTLALPKIFHEDIAKRDLIAKVSFSIILFVGIGCIGGAD